MSEKKESYYFSFETEPIVIENIDNLLDLNTEVEYFLPGNTTRPKKVSAPDELVYPPITHKDLIGYETAGIFRGQIRNWELIPKCYRGDINKKINKANEFQKKYNFHKALRNFDEFCKRSIKQNPEFPDSISDRLSIAQHFGVNTPLLDWSRNIFTAIFFAIRDIYSDKEFTNHFNVYLYHIVDERLLNNGLPEENKLSEYYHSSYISPLAIDRRIERQQGVFTFHPYPGLEEFKIPVKTYILEYEFIERLISIMKGLGYTEDYFFPDYAGIAESVAKEFVL